MDLRRPAQFFQFVEIFLLRDGGRFFPDNGDKNGFHDVRAETAAFKHRRRGNQLRHAPARQFRHIGLGSRVCQNDFTLHIGRHVPPNVMKIARDHVSLRKIGAVFGRVVFLLFARWVHVLLRNADDNGQNQAGQTGQRVPRADGDGNAQPEHQVAEHHGFGAGGKRFRHAEAIYRADHQDGFVAEVYQTIVLKILDGFAFQGVFQAAAVHVGRLGHARPERDAFREDIALAARVHVQIGAAHAERVHFAVEFGQQVGGTSPCRCPCRCARSRNLLRKSWAWTFLSRLDDPRLILTTRFTMFSVRF